MFWLLKNALSLLAVAGAFGFIILIHELGHFVAARRFGVRCPSFAIGFGPALFQFHWRATLFALRAIPFGGYVAMEGEDPTVEGQDTWHDTIAYFLGECKFPSRPAELLKELRARREELLQDGNEVTLERYQEVEEHLLYYPDQELRSLQEAEGNINDKSVPQRLVVMLGGVTMNLITALLLFWFVGAVWGLPQMTLDTAAWVSKVLPESAASRAGLKSGQEILAVNGEDVVSGMEMIEAIGKYPGQTVPLKLKSGNQVSTVNVTPDVKVSSLCFTQGTQGVIFTYAIRKTPPVPPGLSPNSVVTAVDGQPVKQVADFVAAVGRAVQKNSSPNESIKIQLEVNGKPVFLEDTVAQLKPVGKIGIEPGAAYEIRVARQATTLVTDVVPDSPADKAGLQADDHIVAVNGYQVRSSDSLDEVLARLSARPAGSSENDLHLEVVRGDKLENLTLEEIPANNQELGVRLQPVSASLVLKNSLNWLFGTIAAPWVLLFNLFFKSLPLSVVAENTTGPVGIMQMLFEVTDQGIPQFLFFVALINAAIGGMNLFPFPALDGMRCLILVVSAALRWRVDPEKENRVHMVGLVFLLTLMMAMTLMDFKRLLSGVPIMK